MNKFHRASLISLLCFVALFVANGCGGGGGGGTTGEPANTNPPVTNAPSMPTVPNYDTPNGYRISEKVEDCKVADSFQIPFDGYVGGSYDNRVFGCCSIRHLGEDAKADAGTPVRAIGNGEIIYSLTNRQGYGQVIVIQHRLSNGDQYASVYGHLSRQSKWPMAQVGCVEKGHVIGYVGYDSENEDGKEHLHLGIRKGNNDGSYHYYGYAGNGEDVDYDSSGNPHYGNFIHPRAFIDMHGVTTPSISVGGGAPNESIRSIFTSTYNANGGSGILGTPSSSVGQWSNNLFETTYSGYYQYLSGGKSAHSIIMCKAPCTQAYSIMHGFYDTFLSSETDSWKYTYNPVHALLVSPNMNESGSSSLSAGGSSYNYQEFSMGLMVYYVSSPLDDGKVTGRIVHIWGKIYERYLKYGGKQSNIGLPLFTMTHYGNDNGWDVWYQWFEKGFIWYYQKNNTRWTYLFRKNTNVYNAVDDWYGDGWMQ